MLLTALKAEVDEYVSPHAGMRDEAGHALVIGNGVSEPRTVTDRIQPIATYAPPAGLCGESWNAWLDNDRPGHLA